MACPGSHSKEGGTCSSPSQAGPPASASSVRWGASPLHMEAECEPLCSPARLVWTLTFWGSRNRSFQAVD